MEIKTLNNVTVTGTLVKNGLMVRNEGEENECISGELILRTEDGSEIPVNYFTNKYKKKDGKFTSEENKLYESYTTMMGDYVSLENIEEGLQADVIQTGYGQFTANDFIIQDKMVNNNKIKATFANRVEPNKLELNPKVAKFEVNGVIVKMEDEIIKDTPTGNVIVRLDAFNTYENKSNNTLDVTIIPIKLTLPEKLRDGFVKVGFYEGGFAKLTGTIINTTSEETYVEHQAFGEDITHTRSITIKKYEICGGSPLPSLDNLGLTNELYEASKSKRRLKLNELKNKDSNNGTSNQQSESNNPFNPFSN
ncbi:hypothetical protein FC831_13905 [Clostridium botulinum]|nr:hypothetical protein [Clostridium botulinum]